MFATNFGSLLPSARPIAAIQGVDSSNFVVTPHPGWSRDEQVVVLATPLAR